MRTPGGTRDWTGPTWGKAMRTRVSRAYVSVQKAVACHGVDAEAFKAGDKQIARNRLLFGLVAALYIWFVYVTGELDSPVFAVLDATYLLAATLMFCATKLSPNRLDASRKIMLIVDVVALSGAFIVAGPVAAPILFLYFWLIIGYGFRYGVFYLRIAAIASLAGILAALLFTKFWQTQPFVTAGILMLAVVVPCYLELLMRRAIRANEIAKAANDSKALMLAGLGNALRLPLDSILTAAQAISEGILDPMQRQSLDAIHAAAGSLTRELDGLLDVSRLEAGRMPKEVTSFSVRGLIEEAVAIGRAKAASKGIRMSWHITSDVPARIWSERRYLLKSLTNIIDNAVKFTSVGSVLVTVHIKRHSRVGQQMHIEVLDTGLGIRLDARDRIFESFSQASPEILHIYGGAGIGLSVARRMIEALGGRIGVDGVEGRGSSFWFEMPVTAAGVRKESLDSLSGTTVVILTTNMDGLLPFTARLEDMGAAILVSERMDWWNADSNDATDIAERIVVIVDGRTTSLPELGAVLQQGQLFNGVPMIALTLGSGLPEPSIRRRFVTSISPDASEEQLMSSLHLVGAFGQERRMKKREVRHNSSYPGSSSARARARILVAESNRTSVLILSKILEKGGYDFLAVDNGESALDATDQEAFDVVFIEVDKPAVDGLETVKMLRFQEIGLHRNIIIGLTGSEDSGFIARCKEVGCDDVIMQPVDAKKVLDIVARSISQRPESRTGAEQRAEVVRPISSHPRFRVSLGPAIDDYSFPYLNSIGGVQFVGELLGLFASDAELTLAKLFEAVERDDIKSACTALISLGESAAVIGAPRLVEMCKTASIFTKDRMTLAERALVASLRSEVARVVDSINNHMASGLDLPSSPVDGTKPGKP